MSILEVNNVSIRYKTGDFKDIGLKEYVIRKLKRDYNVVEFWADKNISFTLEKGDMLGIIGSNGAGKSTLLKAIAGIMEPTKGCVKRGGNVAALLELASGFDGDLTVKENTYLRGAMLGYTRKFMNETYDQIIDFAELREFENRPFKQLSSGMKSRLAFSIASLVNPDILILDEVLAVGDGAFRQKSEEKMREIINGGATTIMVTHSIGQVRSMCNKVLWLHKGEQMMFGNDVRHICDLYQEFLINPPTNMRLPEDTLYVYPLFCSEEKAATVDIVGCCVVRDIFGYHTDSTQYTVKRFIQSNHPVSMVSPSLEDIGMQNIEGADCVAKNNFWQRLLLTDVNKTAFSDLTESNSDWLILDISEVRYNLVRVINEHNGARTYITSQEALWDSLPLAQEHGKFVDCSLARQNTLQFSQEKYAQTLQALVTALKKVYPVERIILLEVYSMSDYLTENGFCPFKNPERRKAENDLISRCFWQLRQLLPEAHVIRMPKGNYGNPKHKWGQNPRHYNDMYYDYAFKAINVIIDPEIENKREYLNALHSLYSKWYEEQRKAYPICNSHN